MAAHARLSPSGSRRWMSCPGSLVLEEIIPDQPSDYSDKGTACHTVAAECLLTPSLHPSDWLGELIRVNMEDEADRHVFFDQTLCDYTTGYVDEILALTKGKTLHVETRVEFSEYIDVPDQFGTIDAYWLEPILSHEEPGQLFEIDICDLKTGFKWVDVDSSQLKCYALGVLSRYELSHDIRQVRLMIYQPTHDGMREKVISIDELMEFAKTLKAAAQRVEQAKRDHDMLINEGPDCDCTDQCDNVPGPDPEVNVCRRMRHDAMRAWEATFLNPDPNEDDCAFCRAYATCPAMQAKIARVVGADFDTVIEQGAAEPSTMSETALATAQRAAGLLEDWIKSVRAETERRLLQGLPVKWGEGETEGFGLELGRQGNRAWSDPKAVEHLLRNTWRLTVEEAYNLKLISPTDLESMAKAVKPTKKNPNPPKPKISPIRWQKAQAYIQRSNAVPSVKPLDRITEPYSPVQPDADAFDVIPDEGPVVDTNAKLW